MPMQRPRLSWIFPLIVQAATLSTGLAAADDEPPQITITEVKDEEETKPERKRIKIEAESKAEMKDGQPRVFTIIRHTDADGKVTETTEEGGKVVPGKQAHGQVKIVSPDGKTFEIVTSDLATKAVTDKLRESGRKAAAGAGGGVLFLNSKDGSGSPLDVEVVKSLMLNLTSELEEKNDVESPRFIIGVSVSEAPAVVLTQIGKPDAAAVVVDSVVEESPAAKAGVLKFDLILKAADKPVKSPAELTKVVKASAGEAIELLLVRAGKELSVHVTPRTNEPQPEKPELSRGTIQFGPGMMLNRKDLLLNNHNFLFEDVKKDGAELLEEVRGLRKDVEELKELVQGLKSK